MKKILSTIALLIFGYHLHAQNLDVEGWVKDSKGKPIAGANILVKGTGDGVVANTDGHFKITMSSGSYVLIYSFIGYKSLEQKIHVKTEFPWNLEVAMVKKGSKTKGSTKFVERTAVSGE